MGIRHAVRQYVCVRERPGTAPVVVMIINTSLMRGTAQQSSFHDFGGPRRSQNTHTTTLSVVFALSPAVNHKPPKPVIVVIFITVCVCVFFSFRLGPPCVCACAKQVVVAPLCMLSLYVVSYSRQPAITSGFHFYLFHCTAVCHVIFENAH